MYNFSKKTGLKEDHYDYKIKVPLDYNSFASDMKHFGLCYNFLLKQGIFKYKRDKHLDLGAGHGHFSFLLQVLNKVNHSLSLDKRPFVNTDNFNHFMNYYKFLIKMRIKKIFKKTSLLGKFGYVDTNSIYYNLPLIPRKIPNISFTQQDIYKIKGKFDLITSVSSLEFFTMEAIFKKVSQLLNRKGIFFFFVDYYWYPVNSPGIFIDKPFEVQKNKWKKLEKLAKSKKLDVKDVKRRYFYYHDGRDIKPVVDDYIQLAYKNNLKLQSIERHIPSDKIESRINNLKKNNVIGTNLKSKNISPSKVKIKDLNKAIKEIQKFQKNVRIEDLFTHFALLIFEKK